jgi:hypothetical protein
MRIGARPCPATTESKVPFRGALVDHWRLEPVARVGYQLRGCTRGTSRVARENDVSDSLTARSVALLHNGYNGIDRAATPNEDEV